MCLQNSNLRVPAPGCSSQLKSQNQIVSKPSMPRGLHTGQEKHQTMLPRSRRHDFTLSEAVAYSVGNFGIPAGPSNPSDTLQYHDFETWGVREPERKG